MTAPIPSLDIWSCQHVASNFTKGICNHCPHIPIKLHYKMLHAIKSNVIYNKKMIVPWNIDNLCSFIFKVQIPQPYYNLSSSFCVIRVFDVNWCKNYPNTYHFLINIDCFSKQMRQILIVLDQYWSSLSERESKIDQFHPLSLSLSEERLSKLDWDQGLSIELETNQSWVQLWFWLGI